MAVDITNHLIPWAIAKRMQADAWDEGYESRKHQAAQNPPMGFPGHITPKNPYKKEAEQ